MLQGLHEKRLRSEITWECRIYLITLHIADYFDIDYTIKIINIINKIFYKFYGAFLLAMSTRNQIYSLH